jgi:AraC-like DNA-binding protein
MFTGIICSVLLIRKAKKKPANIFLVLGILGFVWLNTKILIYSFDLWGVHGIGFFPNGVELALPPLFYLYAKALLDSKFEFSKKNWLHFIPFFLSQTFAIVVYASIMQTDSMLEKNEIAAGLHFDHIKQLEDYLLFFSTIIYLFVVYKNNQHYKRWLSMNTSDTQLTELRFIRTLLFCFLFIALYTIINLILSNFLNSYHPWRWQLAHLMVAALVYYLGLVGYKNSDNVAANFTFDSSNNSTKSSEKVDLKIIADLNNLMEMDKVYLNPKLSLQELAKLLNLNDATLSNTINAHYQKNFRGYVNDLRVTEVKKLLMQEGLGKLSLLGVAKECGFNSEASFYRIFRSTTGATPKQFLDAHSKQS